MTESVTSRNAFATPLHHLLFTPLDVSNMTLTSKYALGQFPVCAGSTQSRLRDGWMEWTSLCIDQLCAYTQYGNNVKMAGMETCAGYIHFLLLLSPLHWTQHNQISLLSLPRNVDSKWNDTHSNWTRCCAESNDNSFTISYYLLITLNRGNIYITRSGFKRVTLSEESGCVITASVVDSHSVEL